MELRQLEIDGDGLRCTVRLPGGPLSIGVARELGRFAEQLAERPGEVRVLVVDALGDDFCTGPSTDLDPLTAGVDPASAIAALPFPVIAVLRGAVASVGLEIALAADVRIADPTARCSSPEVAAGRLPCWGGTQRLPRLAGRSVASAMLLTGTELDATEALRCGLVHLVTDDAATAAGEMADRLTALAPLALAAAKEALGRGPELPMRHALELEGDLNHLLQTTRDRAEGLAAFFDKRTPRFEGS